MSNDAKADVDELRETIYEGLEAAKEYERQLEAEDIPSPEKARRTLAFIDACTGAAITALKDEMRVLCETLTASRLGKDFLKKKGRTHFNQLGIEEIQEYITYLDPSKEPA